MKLFDTTQTSFHFHNCNVICFKWGSCDYSCTFQPHICDPEQRWNQSQDQVGDVFYSSLFPLSFHHYSSSGSVGARVYPRMHWAQVQSMKEMTKYTGKHILKWSYFSNPDLFCSPEKERRNCMRIRQSTCFS